MSAREDRQREEVEELDRALQAFDDPETAVRPGMQLMRDALRGKREKMAGKLEEQAQVRLDVVVDGVPAAGGLLDPGLLAAVLAAVPAAATDAAAALLDGADPDGADPTPAPSAVAAATVLGVAGASEDGLGVRLVGPPANVRSAVRDPASGRPLLDAALARLLDEANAGDGPAPLAALATEAGASLRLVLRLPFEDEREAKIG